MTEDERFFRVLVDIGHSGIVDFQRVYFEGVDVLHRPLPAALLERRSAGRLAAQLVQVDVDVRLVQHEFGDELPREDLAPVNAGLENGEIDDGSIRIGLLCNSHAFQGQ